MLIRRDGDKLLNQMKARMNIEVLFVQSRGKDAECDGTVGGCWGGDGR